MSGDTVRCWLCQRDVRKAGTSRDKDGHYWCRSDGQRCERIARARLFGEFGSYAYELERRHGDLFESHEEAA